MKNQFTIIIVLLLSATIGCRQKEHSPDTTLASPDAAVSAEAAHDSTPIAPTAEAEYGEFKWESQEHDFGDIAAGQKVSHVFTFINTGKADLLISDAKGSCGCTVPEFPKEPVPPGKTGEIKVSFDSGSRTGKQTKVVTITANTPSGAERLTIKANINK